MTGNQAIQTVQAGLKAIYCSGWQVAGDANTAGEMYPDQSLYPVDSVPRMVERINNALLRTDQIHHVDGKSGIDWLAPIIADAEAGFGGNLNAFELTKALIQRGRGGRAFRGSTVLREEVRTPGRQGAGVDRRSDQQAGGGAARGRRARRADRDHRPHRRGRRESAAHRSRSARPRLSSPASARARDSSTSSAGIEQAIARGLAYAPYADLLWCETSKPDLAEARAFAAAIHAQLSRQAAGLQLLALLQLAGEAQPGRHEELARGARGDGLSLPVHHARGLACAEPVDVRAGLRLSGRTACSAIRRCSSANSVRSAPAIAPTKHQAFVGTGYFDAVQTAITARGALDRRDGRQHRDRAVPPRDGDARR